MKKAIIFSVLFLFLAICYAQNTGKTDVGTNTLASTEATKEPITIKGNVYFDNYKQGYLCIFALTNSDLSNNSLLTHITAPGPGPYILELPPDTKEIYLGCYNDSDNDGPPWQPHDPVTYYEDNGVKGLVIIDKNPMANIDFYLK